MKQIMALLILIISLFSAETVLASADITVIVNGELLDFDVKPVMKNGRTLVPLRKTFESLGINVEWDDHTKTINGIKNDRFITLTVGSKIAYVNNEVVELDVPAEITDGRTLVPVRFIAESLGALVNWDGETQTVIVSLNIEKNTLFVNDDASLDEILSDDYNQNEDDDYFNNEEDEEYYMDYGIDEIDISEAVGQITPMIISDTK